ASCCDLALARRFGRIDSGNSGRAALNSAVICKDSIRGAVVTINTTHAGTDEYRLVIADTIEVIVASDVHGHAVLIHNQSTGRVLGTNAGTAVVNIDWMSGIELEEARQCPAAQRGLHKPIFGLR